MRRAAALAASLLLAAALGGCAQLPTQVHRPPSTALVAPATAPLARVAAASLPADADAGTSAFRLLVDPEEALQARIALLRRAATSIDIQSYLIASDRTGDQIRGELAAAAERGVRVRVLVDDLLATGQDALWSDFAARPGIEVRLFNPLPVRGGGFARRIALSLHMFGRINRRMHNKLFVVDGAFAVVGGRNLADAYFGRGVAAAHFVDLDLAAAGPVVSELGSAFDRYWNSDAAYPVQALARSGPRGVEAAPGEPGVRSASVLDIDDAEATAPFAAELAAGRVVLEPAAATVVVDAPAKASSPTAGARGDVATAFVALLRGAGRETLIASPYLVPDDETMNVIAVGAGSGGAAPVSVTVLTNSAGSTDEPLVHLAYSRRRERMLDAGVALHELMPASEAGPAAALGRPASSLGRLHAKLAVVDGKRLFVGSMNVDRRSAECNTEIALVVESEWLAGAARALFAAWREHSAWRLQRPAPASAIVWASRPAPEAAERIDTVEPNVGAAVGLGRRVVSRLVAEGLL